MSGRYVFPVLLMTATLFSLRAGAAGFVTARDIRPQTVSCGAEKNVVSLSGLKARYTLYEKNLAALKVQKCEKIQAGRQIFYSVLLTGEIHETSGTQKVFIFELAELKGSALNTVRSEVVDQFELAGDPASTELKQGIRTRWGRDKKDQAVMLEITIVAPNEPPEPYLVKYNAKSAWFEDIFSKK